MTDTRDCSLTFAGCDREGQRAVHNMGKISRKCGAEVGPTIQEADWFYLVDASAEIMTTDHLMD